MFRRTRFEGPVPVPDPGVYVTDTWSAQTPVYSRSNGTTTPSRWEDDPFVPTSPDGSVPGPKKANFHVLS